MPEWVFVNSGGGLINGNNFYNRILGKCLVRAGLRQIRIHDLRHTFASLLISQGESLAYVKDQLGHHSIKVTVDIYGHLVPGANKVAIDRLDDTDDAEKRHLYVTAKETGLAPSGLTH